MNAELHKINTKMAKLKRRQERVQRDIFLQDGLPELMVRAYTAVALEKKKPLVAQRAAIELDICAEVSGVLPKIEILRSDFEGLAGFMPLLATLTRICGCEAHYREVKRWNHPVHGLDYHTVILVMTLHPDRVNEKKQR